METLEELKVFGKSVIRDLHILFANLNKVSYTFKRKKTHSVEQLLQYLPHITIIKNGEVLDYVVFTIDNGYVYCDGIYNNSKAKNHRFNLTELTISDILRIIEKL